jgi:hypothetical protein
VLREETGHVSRRRSNLNHALAWSAARWAVDQAIAAGATVIYVEDLRSLEALGMGRTMNTRLSQQVRGQLLDRMRHRAPSPTRPPGPAGKRPEGHAHTDRTRLPRAAHRHQRVTTISTPFPKLSTPLEQGRPHSGHTGREEQHWARASTCTLTLPHPGGQNPRQTPRLAWDRLTDQRHFKLPL